MSNRQATARAPGVLANPPVDDPDPYGPLLDALAAQPREWFLTERGSIRCGTPLGLHCPISAALDKPRFFVSAWTHAALLGLTEEQAFHLACVADGNESDPALRARLEAVTLRNQPTLTTFIERIVNWFRARSASMAGGGE